MAKIQHVNTDKAPTSDQEIPPFMSYGVEIRGEETGERVVEDRVELEGEEYRMLD